MEQQKQEFAILSQYLKDFSFEAPNSPELFFNKEQINANVNLNIDVKVTDLQSGLYDISLIFKIHNTFDEDKTIFLIDLTYAGIIKIDCDDEEKKKKVLSVNIPFFLFPFVRGIIARITSESGFPPFMLNPIDWEVIYKQKKGPTIH